LLSNSFQFPLLSLSSHVSTFCCEEEEEEEEEEEVKAETEAIAESTDDESMDLRKALKRCAEWRPEVFGCRIENKRIENHLSHDLACKRAYQSGRSHQEE
jgi:hypothetical protein